MNIKTFGNGKPELSLVCCLHGTEINGLYALNSIDFNDVEGTVKVIVANEEAVALGKRYVDADLNRSYPGDLNGNHEQQLAVQLYSEIKDSDYVIDIHTTSAKTDPFIITVKENALLSAFAQAIPLEKVVVMNDPDEKSLISRLGCGLAVEFSEQDGTNHICETVIGTLINLWMYDGLPKITEKMTYRTYGTLEQSSVPLTNFERAEINGESFYPVLYGEKAYNFVCLKARK
jgi:hypothetical protein